MCYNPEHFHFIDLLSSIIIPLSVASIAVMNFCYKRKSDYRDINKSIYEGNLKYTYKELFKVSPIDYVKVSKLIKNIIIFKEDDNKFKGRNVDNKFKELYELAEIIKIERVPMDVDTSEWYKPIEKDLLSFKNMFIIFYKSIYEYI
jgi:hypothetical protein